MGSVAVRLLVFQIVKNIRYGGNEMNIQFTYYSSGRRSLPKERTCGTSVTLCCVIKLHILGGCSTRQVVQKDELLLRFGCSFN